MNAWGKITGTFRAIFRFKEYLAKRSGRPEVCAMDSHKGGAAMPRIRTGNKAPGLSVDGRTGNSHAGKVEALKALDKKKSCKNSKPKFKRRSGRLDTAHKKWPMPTIAEANGHYENPLIS